MDLDQDIYQQNNYLEEKFNHLIHILETRIDKLSSDSLDETPENVAKTSRCSRGLKDLYSSRSFLTFRMPYIRDFKDFSAPVNKDAQQIRQLPTGMDDIDRLWRQKVWTKEARHQLKDIVLENYSKIHLIKLMSQKNALLESRTVAPDDVGQKVRLIDEQIEQVKEQKEYRIFVPQDRHDKQIDWCAISARLTAYQHQASDCRLMWSNQLHWTINNGDWTKDEDICLINAVAKHGKNDWDLIAGELDTGRLAWQCCARFHQQFASIGSSYQPESEETEKIIEVINLCRIGNFVPWNQVMYFIQFHGLHQVKYQWQRYLEQKQGGSINISRVWTQEEDLLLLQAVAKFGEKDWARVADCIPGRSNKSCRERYTMRAKYSKRSIGSWKRNEDSKLKALVEEIGPAWSILATHFQERNSHQLRNRYELLKSQADIRKKGPMKHRKLYRSLTSQSVDFSSGIKKFKPAHEKEIDRQLHEIFSTYVALNKNVAPKSLTYRGSQDEQIYHCLVETLCDKFLGQSQSDSTHSHLDLIMREALKNCINTQVADDDSGHSFMLTPSKPTMQAYKAWSLQQDYLSQFTNMSGEENDRQDIALDDIDQRVTKIVVGIFLLPAILSRLKAPEIDVSSYQLCSVIDKQSKNLYKIRNLQSNLLKR